MQDLTTFAISLLSFTSAALLLGLIAGLTMFAVEELGFRRIYNSAVFQIWRNRHLGKFKRELQSPSWVWYALPYKQFVGALASSVQVPQSKSVVSPPIPHRLDSEDAHRLSLGEQFAEIGSALEGATFALPVEYSNSEEPMSAVFAERALDNLQAELATLWSYARYAMAAIIIGLVFLSVASERSRGLPTFLALLLTYPIMFVVAALSAPIFRNLIDRMDGRRA